MALVSVIIPAYNAEKTIKETIQSVQNQTLTDFEIVVVNDGSADRTLEILQGIQDNRLRVFSYGNSGVAVTRNRGISHSTGKFIAFLDADDLWTADKLELQLRALEQNPEAGVAYSWTQFKFIEDEKSYTDTSVVFEGNVYANLLSRNFLHNGSNPLVRRHAIESVGDFDPICIPCEDWDFYLRLAAKWNFALVPKMQIIYRQSPNSASYKVRAMESAALKTIEKAYTSAPLELQHLKKRSLASIYQYCAQQYLRFETKTMTEIKMASHRLWLAIQLQPHILTEKYTQGLIRWLIKSWLTTTMETIIRI